ncbi:MAG: SspB family protein [Alphaproteobacteria bacterium]
MADDLLRYDRMVESALLNVVKESLLLAASEGLPGDHHFFLTFRTQAPGVELADSLHQQYPEEMTIILQHQFWDLQVDEVGLRVTLSFNNRPHDLVVPFAALTSFVDPSVKFGLQFNVTEETATAAAILAAKPDDVVEKKEEDGTADGQSADVVALDSFRKK